MLLLLGGGGGDKKQTNKQLKAQFLVHKKIRETLRQFLSAVTMQDVIYIIFNEDVVCKVKGLC
jgi:hypothetical protein